MAVTTLLPGFGAGASSTSAGLAQEEESCSREGPRAGGKGKQQEKRQPQAGNSPAVRLQAHHGRIGRVGGELGCLLSEDGDDPRVLIREGASACERWVILAKASRAVTALCVSSLPPGPRGLLPPGPTCLPCGLTQRLPEALPSNHPALSWL